MQYSVPQFIDVEDKVIGPLTVKQFIILLVGVGLLFVFWTLAPSIQVFLIPAVPTLGLTAAFAFYKVNGRPFSVFLLAMFNYLVRPKTRLWRREYLADEIKADAKQADVSVQKVSQAKVGQRVTESRLKKLTRLLDTDGGVNQDVYSYSDDITQALEAEKDSEGLSPEERQARVKELLGRK